MNKNKIESISAGQSRSIVNQCDYIPNTKSIWNAFPNTLDTDDYLIGVLVVAVPFDTSVWNATVAAVLSLAIVEVEMASSTIWTDFIKTAIFAASNKLAVGWRSADSLAKDAGGFRPSDWRGGESCSNKSSDSNVDSLHFEIGI
ncbi:hypothetical protein TWF718_003731 [Orbilia javanica]|uniref:Uncharacterized protein n=1 Tax=Orbilia javanica TaxID=47235 RepID=A0AAN8NYR5_9PEZI